MEWEKEREGQQQVGCSSNVVPVTNQFRSIGFVAVAAIASLCPCLPIVSLASR